MRCEFCPDTFCPYRLTAGACHVPIREEIEIVNAPNTAPQMADMYATIVEGLRIKYNPILLAASDLVDAVERYMRQECLRSELMMKKDTLKKLIER